MLTEKKRRVRRRWLWKSLSLHILEVLRDQCPSVLRLYRGCTEAVAVEGGAAAAARGAFLTLLSPYFRGGSSWDLQLWSCQLAIRSQSGWLLMRRTVSQNLTASTLRGCSLSNGQDFENCYCLRIHVPGWIHLQVLLILQRLVSTHCSKSSFFVQKFNFDKTPTFSPNFFCQFFSWNQSCQQLKSPKPQHFHEFQKIRQFFWEIKVEFLDKKWRFRTVWFVNLAIKMFLR